MTQKHVLLFGGVLVLAMAAAAQWRLVVDQPAALADQPKPLALDADKIATPADTRTTVAREGVGRIAWARTDGEVTVDGMPLKPFAGLGSWAAFTAAPHGAMVMGDTVVFQDE